MRNLALRAALCRSLLPVVTPEAPRLPRRGVFCVGADSTIQATMREPIDRFAASAGWQVAHAESEMGEIETTMLALGDLEHEAERTTGRRQVDLYAAGKPRAVPCFLVTGEQCVDRLALAFQSRAGSSPMRFALPVARRRSSCQASS